MCYLGGESRPTTNGLPNGMESVRDLVEGSYLGLPCLLLTLWSG